MQGKPLWVNPRTHHLPSGMMERYLPLNLLEMVMSCHNVHPRLEYTWWAAAGGWWLTWGQETQPEIGRAHV